MHLIQPDLHTRRAFLRRSTQLGLAGTALPFALNLAAMGEAAAFTATDYKALVCVFLYGGNDYANTVITYDDDSYNKYATIRGGSGQSGGGIAIAKADLTATLLNPTTALAAGRRTPRSDALRSRADASRAACQPRTCATAGRIAVAARAAGLPHAVARVHRGESRLLTPALAPRGRSARILSALGECRAFGAMLPMP